MNWLFESAKTRTFFTVWFGQLVSTVGSGLTSFGLGVWVYQQTGSTTLFALSMLAFALPSLLLSPVAGLLADRWDRRRLMILSDTGAGLSTLSIALLLATGKLEIWHVYLATAFNAAFTTFQWPAYSAATTQMVPKEHLGRAGGMVQIGEAISQLFAPAIAGFMLVAAGLQGIVLVDFATFLVAIGTLLVVRFPRLEARPENKAAGESFWRQLTFGGRYIVARPGLLGLLMVFAAGNFLFGLINPGFVPMLLGLTSADKMGYVVSIASVGMLFGTVVMSIWGGPKRRVYGVLGFSALMGLFTIGIGLRPSLLLITLSGFCLFFTSPIINGSSQALWQSKVPVDVQGRVFSVRRMIAWSTMPLAYILAGPLADKVFTPWLAEDGTLADTLVGHVVGVGDGRGVALMIIVIGALSILVALLGYLIPRVRLVEDELPDAVQEPVLKDGLAVVPAQAVAPAD